MILRMTGWLKLFIPTSGVWLSPLVMLLLLLLLVSGRIKKPTRLNCVPSSTTAPFRPLVLAQTRQSLWIYTTVIVENMQTVCEGLHATCKTASGHCDSLTALCLLTSFC